MEAKEDLKKWDTILDEYEKKLQLPENISPVPEDELSRYLTMDRIALEKTSYEECGYIAYRLGQAAFYLQRCQNRETARVNYATSAMKATIADKVGNYKGYSYEERMTAAIKDNDHASKLQKIVIYAKQRSDRLDFLAMGLKNLADLIRSIQISKRPTNDR